MWIGGEWVDAEDGATFDATSPSTGEVIGTVPEGTRADASRAISAAQAAWPARGRAQVEQPSASRHTGQATRASSASEITVPLAPAAPGR